MRTWLVTLVVSMLVFASFASPVDAGTCNGEFGWRGIGTTYDLAGESFIFTGEFSGTFFNTESSDPTHKMTVQCPGLWLVKDGSSTANGACIAKDAAGDKIFLDWSGEGTFPEVSGPFTMTGGTGKFQGISGSGKFKGVSVATDDGGHSMGYATWSDCTYTLGQ